MIYIYTENLCLFPRAKTCIKKMLGRDNRGPQAVVASLIRGLFELGETVTINKRPKEPIGVAYVLSGRCTLEMVIKWKREGLVKTIIAGPNIVSFPDSLIANSAVDIILVPSQWVKDLWVSLDPSLAPRIRVWAAGVHDLKDVQVADRKGLLIYKKFVSREIFEDVVRVLREKNISHTVLEYGSFGQANYFRLLGTVAGVVYLTESESQGMALAEAWIRNVPTLVWDRGLFQGGGHMWKSASSAPYLTDACGLRFTGVEDFEKQVDQFLSSIKTFHPRNYALEHFTDERSAKALLSIIQT